MDLQSLRKLSTGQKERLHELYTMRVLNLLDTTLDPHDLSLVNLAEDPAAVREAIPECMESLAYLELCLIAEPPSDSNSSVSTEDIKLFAILGLLAAIANEWAGLRHAITRALEVSAGSTANNNLLVRSSARLSSVAAQDREVRRALGLYEGPDQDQSNSADPPVTSPDPAAPLNISSGFSAPPPFPVPSASSAPPSSLGGGTPAAWPAHTAHSTEAKGKSVTDSHGQHFVVKSAEAAELNLPDVQFILVVFDPSIRRSA